jgi:hypothetical protein
LDCLFSFPERGFLFFLLPKSVAGFLKLVEHWKGLVVLPCLVSLVEMNETSRPLGKWVSWLVGKDAQPLLSVKLVYISAVLTFMSGSTTHMINLWK